MEVFMGQLIIEDEVDYDAAREYIERKIKEYVGSWAYGCFPKEYRESDEWKKQDLALKLGHVLKEQGDIDKFIDFLLQE